MDANVKKQCFCMSMTDLPNEALYLIFERLSSKRDQESFGLACHYFLDIQSSSRKHLELNFYPWSRISSHPVFGIDFVALDKMFNRFTKLESLCLKSCYDISDSGLYQLQKNGSKLQCLYLDFCSDATDIGLVSVASTCPFLSAISLWSCSSVSDHGLEILTKSCKSLKEVHLGWCDNITDIGILSLNQNCRQLRTLEISWCVNIIGIGFQGMSPTLNCLEVNSCAFDPKALTKYVGGGCLEYLRISFPYKLGPARVGLGFALNLKILDFRDCKLVKDDLIMKISMGCPMLKEWNLSFCDNIGLPGWEWIGLYCQNLEKLHVHNCGNLCDQGLLAVGNGCRLLSVIYISECCQITQSGIESFKMQREDVDINEKRLSSIAPSWAFTFKV
uniref:F-box/LRR-repeat protein 12-like n=1 Tax=Erigeron canadensis TaxID=72917 RepID=UPI001CB8F462|nr:F-box/LRR-repeat protein 12-like [Erigeron canadensis]